MSTKPIDALADVDRETQSTESWMTTAGPFLRVSVLAFALLIAAAVVVGDTSRWDFLRLQRVAKPDLASNAGRSRTPLSDGKTCREIVFDRVTGHILETTDAPCSVPADIARRNPGNFVWGGSK